MCQLHCRRKREAHGTRNAVWGCRPLGHRPRKLTSMETAFFFFTRPSLPGPVRLSARRSLDFSPHYKNAELLPEVRGTRHETHFSNIWLIRFSSQSYLKKKKKDPCLRMELMPEDLSDVPLPLRPSPGHLPGSPQETESPTQIIQPSRRKCR